MPTAFEQNFEEQIKATLPLIEAPGRKVLIVAVYAELRDGEIEGGIARVVSDDTRRGEARAFLMGLEREVARLKRIIGT